MQCLVPMSACQPKPHRLTRPYPYSLILPRPYLTHIHFLELSPHISPNMPVAGCRIASYSVSFLLLNSTHDRSGQCLSKIFPWP